MKNNQLSPTRGIATVSSKGQITLPVNVVRALGWHVPMKVIVEEHDRQIMVTPAETAPDAKKEAA